MIAKLKRTPRTAKQNKDQHRTHTNSGSNSKQWINNNSSTWLNIFRDEVHLLFVHRFNLFVCYFIFFSFFDPEFVVNVYIEPYSFAINSPEDALSLLTWYTCWEWAKYEKQTSHQFVEDPKITNNIQNYIALIQREEIHWKLLSICMPAELKRTNMYQTRLSGG